LGLKIVSRFRPNREGGNFSDCGAIYNLRCKCMTSIEQKTQNALDEGRTLILGEQILLGALYRTMFEPGYQQFSPISKYLVLVALGLNIFSMVFLISPAPYHQIVDRGRDDKDFNRFVVRVMAIALLPFAISMGLSLYVFFNKTLGNTRSAIIGLASTILSALLWYGLRFIPRNTKRLNAERPRG
jgi:hypothetical protein